LFFFDHNSLISLHHLPVFFAVSPQPRLAFFSPKTATPLWQTVGKLFTFFPPVHFPSATKFAATANQCSIALLNDMSPPRCCDPLFFPSDKCLGRIFSYSPTLALSPLGFLVLHVSFFCRHAVFFSHMRSHPSLYPVSFTSARDLPFLTIVSASLATFSPPNFFVALSGT